MDLSTFVTNTETEKEGSFMKIQDGGFWVRRSNYPPYQAAFDKELTRRRMTRQLDEQGARQVAIEINKELVPKFLVSGMENIKLNGKSLEYPKDLSVLSTIPDVIIMLFAFSDDPDNYKDKSENAELLPLTSLAGKSKSA